MSFEIYPSDKNVTYVYQLEIWKVSEKQFLLIHLIVFHQVCWIGFFLWKKIHDNLWSDWREFSKTSRINICDLRFDEILNKIVNEREGNGISRSFDGNGKYWFWWSIERVNRVINRISWNNKYKKSSSKLWKSSKKSPTIISTLSSISKINETVVKTSLRKK